MNRSQKRQYLTPDMIRSKIISAIGIAKSMKVVLPYNDYENRLKRYNTISDLNCLYAEMKHDIRYKISISRPSRFQILLLKIKRLFR